MVSVLPRMYKLRSLLGIRLGPGAAKLPPEVTRIHMNFAVDIKEGHYGSRKFWRNCLPRLKYHNPAIPMTVSRHKDLEGPATLTLHFTSTSPSSTKPETSSTESKAGATTEEIKTIDMKHKLDNEILDEVLKLTNASTIEATEEELQQLKDIEEWNTEVAHVSEMSKKANEQKKREEAQLQQARMLIQDQE